VSPLVLEIIACSVEDAIEAARGGADRLEIARGMDRHGLTPSADIVRRIAREVRLPLRVMVREHDDFRCDRPGELERLCDHAREFDRIGVDGLVLGFVRDGEVDERPLAAVLAAAPRTRATFHRAFDALRDPLESLRVLKEHVQIDRVISGGGGGDWRARCARLSEWAAHAHPRIVMLPGGGVDADALVHITRAPRLPEAHVGSAARIPAQPTAPVSAESVRELRRRLHRAP
jgi:copper homeostasis protein